MFERYTEKARRVIFFARYEASQFGAPAIEPEHLLLGLMREDKTLTGRFFPRAQVSIESIRKEIEGRTLLREKISTSVELYVSETSKPGLVRAIPRPANIVGGECVSAFHPTGANSTRDFSSGVATWVVLTTTRCCASAKSIPRGR